MGRDDLALILDVLRTPNPFKEGEGSMPNDMEFLALAATVDPGEKFKHVVVNLRGVNGNALVIVGTVKQALRQAGASPLELFCFVGECLWNNYENVLAKVCKWVTVTDEAPEPTDDAWSAMLRCVEKNSNKELED